MPAAGRCLIGMRRLLRSRRGRPQVADEEALRAVQLERGYLPVPGLCARILQRLLARNAAIWHDWLIGAPVKRSLVAYDHVSP
jgi:hypothetical protein